MSNKCKKLHKVKEYFVDVPVDEGNIPLCYQQGGLCGFVLNALTTYAVHYGFAGDGFEFVVNLQERCNGALDKVFEVLDTIEAESIIELLLLEAKEYIDEHK